VSSYPLVSYAEQQRQTTEQRLAWFTRTRYDYAMPVPSTTYDHHSVLRETIYDLAANWSGEFTAGQLAATAKLDVDTVRDALRDGQERGWCTWRQVTVGHIEKLWQWTGRNG
jgi:hypothetical protein